MTLKEAIDCAVRVKRHRMEHWTVRTLGNDRRTTWRCKRCGFTVTEITQGERTFSVPEPERVCTGEPPLMRVDERGRPVPVLDKSSSGA